MTDKVEITETEESPVDSAAASAVDLSKYVKVEDFRAMQAAKDKAAQELIRKAQEEAYRRGREEAEKTLMDSLEDSPQVRDVLATKKERIELEAYRREKQERDELASTKAQYAQLFEVDEAVMADAKNPFDAWKLAQKARDLALVERIRAEVGAPKKEGDKPLSVPATQGPAPDASLSSEQEIARREKELKDAIKGATKKSDRDRLRRQLLSERLNGPRQTTPRARV